MIDRRCIGPDVDRSAISPEAEVSGAAYLTGPATRVAAGAVVRDSRLHNTVVEAGASVTDSICVAEGEPASHQCDAAGRTVVRGAAEPSIGRDAVVAGSTLINCTVGARTRVQDTWARDSRLGPDGSVSEAKLVLVETGTHVTIKGPTEVSEAHVGHHATLDRRGYLEGIFSNRFHKLRFNPGLGRLEVTGTIDLPHLSRYGVNTINSTNSGKLLPQPEEGLSGFGPRLGLWQDPLLSHEQIELGPCCWVCPWTKVVGQSPEPHHTDEELVNDPLTTYLMPFAVAGCGGEITRGLVMPGELSNGFGPKQREGAWTFTYAPGAVIGMVARLHEALENGRKHIADTIVTEALRTALEMTKAMAAARGVDLALPPDEQRAGWPRWVGRTHALLTAHMETGLWEFDGGRPVGWQRRSGRWTHPALDRVLSIAPDALEKQVDEEAMFRFEDPVPAPAVALPEGAVAGTGGEPEVCGDARIGGGATVGPGCRIGPGTVIESGARVWNSVLSGTTVEAGATIERSILKDGRIGRDAVVRSCRMTDAALGEGATANSAALRRCRLAENTTVSAFADVLAVNAGFSTIIGGTFHHADVDCYLMSMHMAGAAQHVEAVPFVVELDGERVPVPAIPMLGGGSVLRGTRERPVRLQCAFIGSNAIVESGTRIGLGCFVLGRLGPGVSLPPFTISTGPGPRRRQIGAVLANMASTVITHFINWTYQAVGPERAPAVAQMTVQAIRQGQAAVKTELARRESGRKPAERPEFDLSECSDRQLRQGLDSYRRALESGAWELEFRNGELRFASDKGRWLERRGSAHWVQHD